MRWMLAIAFASGCSSSQQAPVIDGPGTNQSDARRAAIDAPGGGGGDGRNDGITVTWGAGCWYSDSGHRYQAMSFTVETATPVPLEGSLYFDTTCDPSNGIDNLNDTGGTVPSGSWTFWFIHHPDNTSTSAVWWIGSHDSPCIDYSTAPDCS